MVNKMYYVLICITLIVNFIFPMDDFKLSSGSSNVKSEFQLTDDDILPPLEGEETKNIINNLNDIQDSDTEKNKHFLSFDISAVGVREEKQTLSSREGISFINNTFDPIIDDPFDAITGDQQKNNQDKQSLIQSDFLHNTEENFFKTEENASYPNSNAEENKLIIDENSSSEITEKVENTFISNSVKRQTVSGWLWKRVMDKYVRGTSSNILHELEVGMFDISEFANYQRVDEAVSGSIASGDFKQVALLLEKLHEVHFKPNNLTIESAYKFLKIKQLRDEEALKLSLHEKMSLYYNQRQQLLQKILIAINDANKEMISQYEKFTLDINAQIKDSLKDVICAKKGRVACSQFLPRSTINNNSTEYNSDYDEPSINRYTESFLLDRVHQNQNIMILENHVELSQGIMNQVSEKLGIAISYKQ